jgi:choline dehydrogenase-like flavoprotein
VYSERLPDRANAVSLAANVRDYSGSLATHSHYRVGPYERKALDKAKEVASGILADQGLSQIRSTGVTAGHQLGTHQTGTELATSVVDVNLGATRSRTCTWWTAAAL